MQPDRIENTRLREPQNNKSTKPVDRQLQVVHIEHAQQQHNRIAIQKRPEDPVEVLIAWRDPNVAVQTGPKRV